MLIKYKGGKTWLRVSPNRVPYIFSIENNRTLDIKDLSVINYIFSLPNRAEFEVMEKEPEVQTQVEKSKEEVKEKVKEKSVKKKSKYSKKGR